MQNICNNRTDALEDYISIKLKIVFKVIGILIISFFIFALMSYGLGELLARILGFTICDITTNKYNCIVFIASFGAAALTAAIFIVFLSVGTFNALKAIWKHDRDNIE